MTGHGAGSRCLLVRATLTFLQSFPGGLQERFYSELAEADALFKNITGRSFDPLWRAPYGACSLELLRWGAQRNLHHVYWTYDTLDWRTNLSDPLSRSGTSIVRDLLTYHEQAPNRLNGAIILLHLGAQRVEDPLYFHLASLLSIFFSPTVHLQRLWVQVRIGDAFQRF